MFEKVSRYFFLLLILSFGKSDVIAQNSYAPKWNVSLKIPAGLMAREDSLQKEFAAKGLEWPVKYMFIRSFKYDGQLEVWVKGHEKDKFKLFKTYKVCLLSGAMGPKRMQGDFQVPEGFYYITEFNPRSAYHLALGLNYPNASDKILSDSLGPETEFIFMVVVFPLVVSRLLTAILKRFILLPVLQKQVARTLFRCIFSPFDTTEKSLLNISIITPKINMRLNVSNFS
jgi:hypothetical protein